MSKVKLVPASELDIDSWLPEDRVTTTEAAAVIDHVSGKLETLRTALENLLNWPVLNHDDLDLITVDAIAAAARVDHIRITVYYRIGWIAWSQTRTAALVPLAA